MRGSLSIKIFSYFAVVIIMSLSIIGGFTYLYASKAIERQTADNIAQTIRNTAYQTDLYLKNYDRATYTILSSNDVKRFLDMDPDDSYSYFFYTKQIQGNVLQPTFLTYPQIAHIYLIGRNGRMVADDNQTPASFPHVDAKKQFDKLWRKTPGNGTAAILTQSIRPSRPKGAVTIARRVRGIASYQPNGVLAMEFNSRELSRIWGELDLGTDSFVYVLDQENRVVYASERKGAAEALPNEAVKRTALENSFRLKMGGAERLFVTERRSFPAGEWWPPFR
ncbi:cache domain-containing protein [Paenibacillus sp. DMB20]|uniref:cache domain-containing protein n=1 Tax=Paenibacillus sp. DMB20 TaxID=1642570 RepID=UPI00069C86B5|nr:cache domain-containing protein [Paenibacillus sp. DMB20]